MERSKSGEVSPASKTALPKKNEIWDETESSISTEEPIRSSGDGGVSEGGWAWMVVMASFFNTFILDGIGSGFGLLYPHVLDKFKATAFLTSFAGSLFVSYMVMGSFSACLIARFGFRLVGMAGGILCCLSFVAAAYCSNIYIFILTFGLLAGCSTGLVYIPSVVVVNSYFNKRRGLANGIVSSGAGAGLLVLAPIISWMLTQYALEGTILILGGITLNMTMFSCLFFPVRQTSHMKGHDDGTFSEEESAQVSTDSESLPVVGGTIEKDNDCDASPKEKDHVLSPDKQIMDFDGIDLEDGIESNHTVVPKPRPTRATKGLTGNASHRHLRPSSLHSNSSLQVALLSRKHKDHPLHGTPWGSDHRIAFKKTGLASDESAHYSVDNIAHLLLPPASNVRGRQLTSHGSKNVGVTASQSHSVIGSHLYLAGSLSNLHNTQTKYLKRSCMSSLNALPSQPCSNGGHDRPEGSDMELSLDPNSHHVIGDEEGHVVSENVPHHPLTGHTREQNYVISDAQLEISVANPKIIKVTLKDLLVKPVFVVFCCGACFIQFGYPVIGTFLADYAAAQGINSNQTALIISLIGCFNIVGRLLGGSLASLGVDLLRLHNMMLLFGAVVCLMCPLYTSFWPLCAFAAMFGLFLGFFPPLQPLIIVEYFGLSALGSAFGFLSMLKGLATMCGPPIAGWVYDSCRDYSLSIVFAGSAFLTAAIVHQTMICFKH